MKVNFDTKFFQKKNFEERTVREYFNNALKDLKIAAVNKNEEVVFKFSYDALIKIGITLIAFLGFRVKSRRGHHIKILDKLSQILDDENIILIGEAMRKKRNLDLYEGGILISEREAKNYFSFVKKVARDAEKYLSSQKSLF